MFHNYEVIYITRTGQERCYGDFEADAERALFVQQWLEYNCGCVAWIERA